MYHVVFYIGWQLAKFLSNLPLNDIILHIFLSIKLPRFHTIPILIKAIIYKLTELI